MQAHQYKSKSGACSAFLANYNQRSYAKVTFGKNHYNLPPWSISILPDCKNTVYNTARVKKIHYMLQLDIMIKEDQSIKLVLAVGWCSNFKDEDG